MHINTYHNQKAILMNVNEKFPSVYISWHCMIVKAKYVVYRKHQIETYNV